MGVKEMSEIELEVGKQTEDEKQRGTVIVIMKKNSAITDVLIYL